MPLYDETVEADNPQDAIAMMALDEFCNIRKDKPVVWVPVQTSSQYALSTITDHKVG